MASYSTPGVYVEEVSKFPPSVVEVATAVPAFIGFTEKASVDQKDVTGTPVRISNLLEFTNYFGGPDKPNYQVNVIGGEPVVRQESTLPTRLLYYHVDLYFKNGGGPCYVCAVGDFGTNLTAKLFTDAFAALQKEDEPTLYVFPDALALEETYYSVVEASLRECGNLGDRFTIIDVPGGTSAGAFRTALSSDQLKYGAAYTPYLDTTLVYEYNEGQVQVTDAASSGSYQTDGDGLKVTYDGSQADNPSLSIMEGSPTSVSVSGNNLTITVPSSGVNPDTVAGRWDDYVQANPGSKFSMEAVGGGTTKVVPASSANFTYEPGPATGLDTLKDSRTSVYNNVISLLNKQRVTLPSSAAMAGIYANIDRTSGVWKAPANAAVSSIIGPSEKITHEDQKNLNIDANSGKSINAIRTFTGQGTLVWGARTLAGNDNEWRYISVRRLFNMVEESCKKATQFAVFEPNDATTWLKVKGMIESFLFDLYEQGAFAGPQPDKAYYVHVGLGETMTAQDILNGRMIVEIGIAAVRPAEFIVLRFSQLLQQA